jgi:hypothetical protein
MGGGEEPPSGCVHALAPVHNNCVLGESHHFAATCKHEDRTKGVP